MYVVRSTYTGNCGTDVYYSCLFSNLEEALSYGNHRKRVLNSHWSVSVLLVSFSDAQEL